MSEVRSEINNWFYNDFRAVWIRILKIYGWSHESPSFKALWAQWDSLRVNNGLLKLAWESPDGRHVTMQLVIPAFRTKEVLQEMHNGGSGAHSGINKTLSKIRERFYWVCCREHVESWREKCGG